jgi:PAS domain S-box-containing protein
MTWQQTPEFVPLMVSAALCAGLGIFAWAHRRVPAAVGFVLLMASCAWWSFFYGLYRGATTLGSKLLLAEATQAGAIVVPLAWLLFTLQYTRRERWLTPGRVALVSAVPLLTLAMALTNPLHHQFWAVFDLVPRAGYIQIDSREAWGFWLHVGYSWALLSACVALLSLTAIRSVRIYRRQAAAIVVAALVPWVGNVLHVGKVVRFPLNPMPILFTLTGVVFFWAIFRLRLLDVVPVARETLVEELPDGVLVLDDGDRLLDLNPAARALLGTAGDEWLGRPAAGLVPALGPLLRAAHEGAERRIRAEVELGHGRTADVRITRLHDDLGAPAGRVVVLRDLSEREQREGALTLQRAYLDQLFEASPDAIALLNAEDRVLNVNGEFTRVFGYTAAEATGRPINDLIVPRGLADEGRELTGQVVAGQRVGVETTRARRDGTTLDVHVSGTPVFVEGRQVAIWAIYRDISRRRAGERARAELLAREQDARAAAESAGRRAAFLADVGTLLSASFDYGSSYRELARLAVPELADYCLIDVVEPDGGTRRVAVAHHDAEKEKTLIHDASNPHDGDLERRPVLRVVRTGEPLLVQEFTREMMERLSHDDRHRESFRRNGLRSFLIVPLTARGRTLGAITLAMSDSDRRYGPADLAVAQDMARRAALAIDNARLYREAQEAVRARDSVLGVVSHDLRNPLTSIFLNADSILQAPDLPPWVLDGLGMIVRSAESMEHLIRDLLDVARIEAGQLRVSPRPHDPARLVLDAAELFTPLAEERGVHLVAIPPEGAPSVRADRDRTLQVFSNLVGNALKLTPRDGMITLGAAGDGGGVRFWVRDTGPGIPESDFPHLFDRFWQGKGRRDGAGLGLPIARGIVEAHGGRVWVESELGMGTTFHFTLGDGSA